MNTIERIKHGVENRTKELTILIIGVIVISASWLINSLLYPDKPALQNPALVIISIIICFGVWLYLFKTEWFKKFKKGIIIKQQKLNFMRIIRIIAILLYITILVIIGHMSWWLISGPLLSDLFPTYHILMRILVVCGIAIILLLLYKFRTQRWGKWKPIEF